MALPHILSTTTPRPSPPPFHPPPNHLPLPSSDRLENFPHFDSKDSTEDRPESEKKELWSFRDTSLLLDFYEEILVTLGRGMIRKKDWNKISEELTQQSGFARSAEQCKNRIEYLRKHYRKEKARSIGSNVESQWAFYKKLEALVEDHSKQPENSKQIAVLGTVDGGDYRSRPSDFHGNGHAFLMAEEEPSSPPNQNSHPVDTLDEEETVATAKAQAASTPETPYKPCKKRRKLGASLGKDLKEGLSEFAAVMERIERTKMELVLMLERQRAEQEQKRAEMEMERTKMLLQNQLEVAKLFCSNRVRGRGGEKNDGK